MPPLLRLIIAPATRGRHLTIKRRYIGQKQPFPDDDGLFNLLYMWVKATKCSRSLDLSGFRLLVFSAPSDFRDLTSDVRHNDLTF